MVVLVMLATYFYEKWEIHPEVTVWEGIDSLSPKMNFLYDKSNRQVEAESQDKAASMQGRGEEGDRVQDYSVTRHGYKTRYTTFHMTIARMHTILCKVQ